MDALSELLRVIRLDSAIYINAELSEPWCLASPEASRLGPALAPGTGHLIIYHLLCDGAAYVELEDGGRVALAPGDLVSFPHGHGHRLGNGLGSAPIDVATALPEVLARGMAPLQVGGGGPSTRFICGFLACDPELSQAALGGLPPLVRVNIRDEASGNWLENSLRFSVNQAAAREPGASAMLARLSEALFAETLRIYARDLPDGHTGWFAGARDATVGKALTLLHHRPVDAWTLEELARQTGASRSVLADRFRHFLGQSPMAYLTHWRLRLGARALISSTHSVARIAADVGYESESSFNRAFKRQYQVPPARYRKQRTTKPPVA
jgi:AraC-like DNA-binding protein